MRPKILLGALLLLAGSGLAAWLWIHSAAERKWASMERRVAELRAEAETKDCRRPPRPGLAPGNAWDDYVAAIDLLRADPGLADALPDSHDDPVDAAKVEALLDRNPRVMLLLRSGARRSEARNPQLSDAAALVDLLVDVSWRELGIVAATSARRHARQGRIREATDELLDLLQLGNDATRDALSYSAWDAEEIHKEAARELLLLPRTERILPELERLEAELPGSEADLKNERLRLAPVLMDGAELGGGWHASDVVRIQPTPWQARRFGFSSRLMRAAAFEELEEFVRATEGVDALPYPAAEALAAELRARAAGSGNPVFQTIAPHVLGYLFIHRSNLTRLRLLRAAFDPALDLEDPFGGRIRRAANKVWSAGTDGVDDGGVEGKDVVFTIP